MRANLNYNYGLNGFRYGFNSGSERDDEIKGAGNSYTTYFRQLDTRLGRWLSIDPKTQTTPWESTYASMGNNPIWANDPMGDKAKIRGKKNREKTVKHLDKAFKSSYKKIC